MKIKYSILMLILMSPALMAADVNWVGPIIFTPAAPAVGDNVQIKANLSVSNGDVPNLNVKCTIDGNVVYTKLYSNIKAPKNIAVTFNWTAAHSTKTVRLQGQSSNVKVELSFSSKVLVTTNGNSIEATIPVKDAAPTFGIGQTVGQKKPDLELAPCYANANGTTDLVPVEFSFKYLQYGKFQYTIGIKNTGPRCVKKFHYKITYLNNGVDTVYREAAFPVKPNGWVLEAGETRQINGTFDRHDLPYQIFQTIINSEEQEIDFSLIGLKLVVDYTMEVAETNETNNVYETGLHWVED